jgi:thioredoxin reductase
MPKDLLAMARAELSNYPTVSHRSTRVVGIRPVPDGFEFNCADGTSGTAPKVLLASGLVDKLPELHGIESLYGISVHHCLYCDGFEYSDKPVAAYGRGEQVVGLAIMMKHWIADVVACSDGADVSRNSAKHLAERGIPLRQEPITALVGTDGRLAEIKFEQGPPLARDAMFFATGSHQVSDLSKQLGCQRDEKGGVITDPDTEEASVAGVYVAGDVSRDVLMVSIAVAEGAKAAVAINKAFLRRDGFL